MVATAAHLVDHVLPPLPLRQWVLSVPKRLRYFLQDDAAVQGLVMRILVRTVENCLRAHSIGGCCTRINRGLSSARTQDCALASRSGA